MIRTREAPGTEKIAYYFDLPMKILVVSILYAIAWRNMYTRRNSNSNRRDRSGTKPI